MHARIYGSSNNDHYRSNKNGTAMPHGNDISPILLRLKFNSMCGNVH